MALRVEGLDRRVPTSTFLGMAEDLIAVFFCCACSRQKLLRLPIQLIIQNCLSVGFLTLHHAPSAAATTRRRVAASERIKNMEMARD